MKKSNYAAELEIMIHCGIIKDVYTETTENIVIIHQTATFTYTMQLK